MLLMPLITAAMEMSLNRLIFRERSLHSVRQRLLGKVLQFSLRELKSPIIILFHEKQVDVLSGWQGEVHCTIQTSLMSLPQLRDRNQLPLMLKTGELVVEGDIQVIQHFATLLDGAEWDPAEYLAPYLGDIFAEGVGRTMRQTERWLKYRCRRDSAQLATVMIDEWRLAPSPLEVIWLTDQIDELIQYTERLNQRLDRMEQKS